MSTQDSGNSQPLFPSLCKNGCGFFSGIDSKGFCSVCYKKYLKKEAAEKDEEIECLEEENGQLIKKFEDELTLKEEEEDLAEVAVAPVVAEVKAEAIAEDQPSSSSTDGAAATVTIEKVEEPKETKKKKNRCLSCKKKVGLTGFTCRCGGLFCSIHRYSDKHECNFDYKAMGEKEISEANPLIVAAKVAKI